MRTGWLVTCSLQLAVGSGAVGQWGNGAMGSGQWAVGSI